jgi:hypothetical protein
MFKKIASIVLASSLVFGVVVPAAYADTAGAKYKDGTYTGEATVVPDEDEDLMRMASRSTSLWKMGRSPVSVIQLT